MTARASNASPHKENKASPVKDKPAKDHKNPKDAETQPLFVLASASPRRRELLEACGLSFEIVPAEVDESPGPNESPEALVTRLSALKAQRVQRLRPWLPVISADTLVALGNKIFGKPESLPEARAMLGELSGQTHRVVTGYCVTRPGQEAAKPGLVTTKIAFRKLTAREIDWYLSLNQSLDKAGAYALQMGGGFLVDWLEGSYTSVIGLPLRETLEALSEALGSPLPA
ncbi:MAG: Maf family protein [Deltaproteobacteria bacterium]|nr:Maf family protein [Deltaproteobacteria bacterium]